MSGAGSRKANTLAKVTDLLSKFNKMFVVGCDHVGSNHMQQIRISLRESGSILLMGKNTLIRKAIRNLAPKNPALEALVPVLSGNVGFVLTNDDLSKVRDVITSLKKNAAAKAGVIAPCSVTIPAGPTGLEPSQTSFLQALNIATKIARSQIEILTTVNLITEGQKVGSSEAALLQKLKIMPFMYGLKCLYVYDNGSLYDVKVLDITDDDIVAKFMGGVSNVAAFGLGLGVPNMASIPHVIVGAYKNLVALALATDITFDRIKELKELLNDPEALAKAQAAAAQAAAAPAAATTDSAAAAEPAQEEEEEEDEDDMDGFGLFD